MSGLVTAVTSNADGTTTVTLSPMNLQDAFKRRQDPLEHGAG
jgi:hypothetical protein